MARVKKVSQNRQYERVDYGHTDLILNLIKDEQHVLTDDRNTADDDDRMKRSAFVPIGLCFAVLLISEPPKVMALLQQQNAYQLSAEDQISTEYHQFQKYILSNCRFAGLYKHKQQERSDNAVHDSVVSTDGFIPGSLLIEIIEEEHNYHQEMHR